MKKPWAWFAASAVAGLLLAACGDDDPVVSGNGGSGGTSGGSAGTGGTGGLAGSAGDAGTGGQAGSGGSGGSGGEAPARFTAAVTGEVLLLTPLDPVWVERCSNSIQSIQRSNGSWVALRDDRPEAFGGHYDAHYVGNTYHSACNLSLGCDVSQCSPLTADPEPDYERLQPPAREYVQVGQAQAPLCGEEDAGVDAGAPDAGDAGGRLVPTLESRAPSGQLGVRVSYFRNNTCSGTPLTADVPVE